MRLPIVTPARVRHATWLALLIPCWAGGPAGAQVPAEDPRVARLVQVVRAGMDAYGIPGSVLAISIGGQRVTRALGATSVENPLPITTGTLFQIGSITKTMTALAVMRLVDQGRLSLDAPLREALPDFRVRDPDATQRATLRTTLTHMGGWEGDIFEDPGGGDDALALLVRQMSALQQVAPFGTLWSYNNAGFCAAGRVIEVATGLPFERALQALVLEPLGMGQSWFFAADIMTRRFAAGHASPRGARWSCARGPFRAR